MTVSFSPPRWKLRLCPQPYESLLSKSCDFSSLALSASGYLPTAAQHFVSSRAWPLTLPEACSTGGWNLAHCLASFQALHTWPAGSAPPRASVPISSHSVLCPSLFPNCFLSSLSFLPAPDCVFCRWDGPACHCRTHPSVCLLGLAPALVVSRETLTHGSSSPSLVRGARREEEKAETPGQELPTALWALSGQSLAAPD